jgi:hypothetical protein
VLDIELDSTHSSGSCDAVQYSSPLPIYYQHFTDTTLGGSSPWYDYCPIIAVRISILLPHQIQCLELFFIPSDPYYYFFFIKPYPKSNPHYSLICHPIILMTFSII